MEARLSRMNDLGFEEENKPIKVAVTTFAFDNSEVIALLTQRGTLIKQEKWDKMREVEAKINTLKNE